MRPVTLHDAAHLIVDGCYVIHRFNLLSEKLELFGLKRATKMNSIEFFSSCAGLTPPSLSFVRVSDDRVTLDAARRHRPDYL